MGKGESDSDHSIKGWHRIIGSDWYRHFPAPDYTEEEDKNKRLPKQGLTVVSHGSLAVSLAMLCQSFLGTILTLIFLTVRL